jgi:SAM-dependent methyltransferase
MERVRAFLRQDMRFTVDIESGGKFNYLTKALRDETRIIDTDNISAYPYYDYILSVINEFNVGIILDCGAGRRPIYYENIVNFEIVDYDTTDVLGVGEHLPFCDNTFDAILSLAVLEHVRDPMQCANEIARVLKPGGKLLCQMPFLQPLHGYPHHYFNATHQGLRRLFEDKLQIESVSVPYGLHPIFALQWIIQSWANGLSGDAKQQFLDARMSDFMVNPVTLMDRQFATQLPHAQQVELACGNMIEARKPV